MPYFTVQVERREELQGVVSVVSILDDEGNDVTEEFEQHAEDHGLDLQGTHLRGDTEQDVENEIKRYISVLTGFPMDEIEVTVDG